MRTLPLLLLAGCADPAWLRWENRLREGAPVGWEMRIREDGNVDVRRAPSEFDRAVAGLQGRRDAAGEGHGVLTKAERSELEILLAKAPDISWNEPPPTGLH